MALVTADRVYETSTTTGTGTYTLAGAKNATFQAFSAVCANNDTVYYCAFDTANGGWETGIGTWATGGTLARTTVQTSSNANAAVSWAAGTREIFLANTVADLARLVVGPSSATANNLVVFDGTTGKLVKDGGLPPSEVLISEVTPSGTGVVTFSSLGSYRSLRITGMGRGTQAATSVLLQMTFNSDTGANYLNERDLGSSTTAQASNTETAFVYAASICAANAPSGNASAFYIYIPDFAGTTFHKSALGKSSLRVGTGSTSHYVVDVASWWLNTAAITSITLTLSAGNYVAGTRISLYGVN